MQIPYRKPGKFSLIKRDPQLTAAKFDELKKQLEKLKIIKPEAAAEVARLAELGDFSENAEYQLAKGRLRGINYRMLEIESELNQAEIITPQKDIEIVQLGHTVIVEAEGSQKTFQILGSAEANPAKGVISHNSPLGAALVGRKVGDKVAVKLASKEVTYTIIKIA